MLAAAPLLAQRLSVLHPFGSGPSDGANPITGVTIDGHGNLYGTAQSGGHVGGPCGNGCGTVFELKRVGSGFLYNPLYSFQGGNDGAEPETALTIGPNGSLYGTTIYGGGSGNYGTVFNLKPSPTFCQTTSCPWRETQILDLNGFEGGEAFGQLTFDASGNIYGTAASGGSGGQGVVFELSPSNGNWTENILYSFTVGRNGGGYQPLAGVIFDRAGNIYGTSQWGSQGGYGAVYQLTPNGDSWTETTLYSFTGGNDGGRPNAKLLMDAAGNLYGTTPWVPETNNPGTVFELTPSGGGWTYHLLYSFPMAAEGAGGVGSLAMDHAGNLYGTASFEGNQGCYYGCGIIYELSPSANGWSYTELYDFTGGTDGYYPYSGVVLDSDGNLYGTAQYGGSGADCLNGAGSCGTVWELSPR